MGKSLGPTGEFFRRRDEWRKHPMLGNQLRHATPGLGIALVAFGILIRALFDPDLKHTSAWSFKSSSPESNSFSSISVIAV
ncbi:hypothetical protein REPUB_Repub14bG0012400 [Reevesia pubescens]